VNIKHAVFPVLHVKKEREREREREKRKKGEEKRMGKKIADP
jgi:hypothetical protein